MSSPRLGCLIPLLLGLVLLCGPGTLAAGAATAPTVSVDDANSTTPQANGIPKRVASNIYIQTGPLGVYAGDVSRYARTNSNDALITYASTRGFTSLTVYGFSRETSVWRVTVSYAPVGKALDQKSFTIDNVDDVKTVDRSDANNKWQSWTLRLAFGDGCPLDLGLVLSDSTGDNGWGLQIGKVELQHSNTSCSATKTVKPTTPTAPAPVAPVPPPAIDVPADCIPKASMLVSCGITGNKEPAKQSTDTLDSLGTMSEHINLVLDSGDAKTYFRGDKGRVKRNNNLEGSITYHVDSGIQQLDVTYFRCEPTDASLYVLPFSDPSCMATPVALNGQPDKQAPSGCWKRYTAQVVLNETSSSNSGLLLNSSFCPPSDVKLVIRGGKDGSELQLTEVVIAGYGSLSSAKSDGLFPLMPINGGKNRKLLPTKAWIPIISCILGAAFAAAVIITYKCGGMRWIDQLITGRDRKPTAYGSSFGGMAAGKPVGKGGRRGDGDKVDMEAPSGRSLSRQLSAAWSGNHSHADTAKSPTESRAGSLASANRAASVRHTSPASARHTSPGMDDPVIPRYSSTPSFQRPHDGPQAVRPAVARAMTFEPNLPPPIRTRPRRDGPPNPKLISDEYTPISTHRSPTPKTTAAALFPLDTKDHKTTFTPRDPTPPQGRPSIDPSPMGRTHNHHEFRPHTPPDGLTTATPTSRTPTPHDSNIPAMLRTQTPRDPTPPPAGRTSNPGERADRGDRGTPSQTPTQAAPTPHVYDPSTEGTTLKANPATAVGTGGKVLEERLADLQKKIVEIKKYLSHRKPDSCTTNDKKLVMMKRIGQGGFGVVWKANWEGTIVAVKIMVFPNNMSGEEKAEKMALMEMAISGFLTHPNIVQTFTCEIRPIQLEEATASMMSLTAKLPSIVRRTKPRDKGSAMEWMDWSALKGSNTQDSMCAPAPPSAGPRAPSFVRSFFNEKDPANNYSWELRIIMEYCDAGTLKDALKARRFLLDSTPGLMMDHVLLTALDIARGVRHLHEHQVIHGDLKPHNILLRRSKSDARGYVAKIADFGLSIKMQAKQTIVSGVTQGTDGYMSPEVIHQGKVLPASDVYSYGIMLWELYTCRAVHDDLRAAKLPKHLITKWRPPFPPNCPHKYVNLAQQCWDPNPYNRPTFKTVMDELSDMLKLVRRQTVQEAKQLAAEAAHRSGPSGSGPSTSKGPGGVVPDSLQGVAPTTQKMYFPDSNS